MTKKELEYWYKSDLARLFKNDFAEYKAVADVANMSYKRACLQQGTPRPTYTPEWNRDVLLKNKYQHEIERKLPKTVLFDSIYKWWKKLVENGTINDPITNTEVLKIAQEGVHIGRIHEVGSLFRSVAHPERIFQINGISNRVSFLRLSDNRQFSMSNGEFQNNVKDGVIEYIIQTDKIEKDSEVNHQISFDELGK